MAMCIYFVLCNERDWFLHISDVTLSQERALQQRSIQATGVASESVVEHSGEIDHAYSYEERRDGKPFGVLHVWVRGELRANIWIEMAILQVGDVVHTHGSDDMLPQILCNADDWTRAQPLLAKYQVTIDPQKRAEIKEQVRALQRATPAQIAL